MRLLKLKDGTWLDPEKVFMVKPIPESERATWGDGRGKCWFYGPDNFGNLAQEEADELADLIERHFQGGRK